VLPANFKLIAEYFVIPLLVLLISYAISGQFNLKYSAGTDFFVFVLSADLGAVMEFEDLLRAYQSRFSGRLSCRVRDSLDHVFPVRDCLRPDAAQA
jgi:hypothetical protein